MHKEATTNFEVDRTISHTKLPVGSIKRLSVAVLINNRTIMDSKGKPVSKPFTPAEQAELNILVKNAMGFNAQRGDSLNLLNSAFNEVPEVVEPEVPLWKQPAMLMLAKEWLKYLLMGGAALYLFFGIIRPAYRNLVISLTPPPPPEPEVAVTDTSHEEKVFKAKASEVSYESSLQAAKELAAQSPKIVASVVQEWVNN